MKQLAVYCISAGRAPSVAPMIEHLRGMNATWVVPQGDGDAYAAAGVNTVAAVPGNLANARNYALEHAFSQGAWCVQTDDDLLRVKWLMLDGKLRPIPLADAVAVLADALEARPHARHAGAAPTDNPYFARGGHIRDWGFVLGSLTVTAPTRLRYDPTLLLKEDWDYTCQQLLRYGAIVRCDAILPTFRHYTNSGGAVRYRTTALETQITARLLDRWPDLLRPHPRRPHELALKRRVLTLTMR